MTKKNLFPRQRRANPLKSLEFHERSSEICAVSRAYQEGEGKTAPLIRKASLYAPPSPEAPSKSNRGQEQHRRHILCGRCTGLRYLVRGQASGPSRRAQDGARLKATRFHGGPMSRRPGTMERRAEPQPHLRRSEAVGASALAGRTLAAFKHETRNDAEPPLRRGLQ